MPATDEPEDVPEAEPRTTMREPGEVVLRAEAVTKPTVEPRIEPLEYNKQTPDFGRMFPYGINWWRVCLAGFVLVFALLVLFSKFIPTQRDPPRGGQRVAAATLDVFADAIKSFHKDTGQFPSAGLGLDALVQQPMNAPNWMGPYIKFLPADPWKTPYQYVFPGVHNIGTYDLSSAGPDKKFGTADDVRNW